MPDERAHRGAAYPSLALRHEVRFLQRVDPLLAFVSPQLLSSGCLVTRCYFLHLIHSDQLPGLKPEPSGIREQVRTFHADSTLDIVITLNRTTVYLANCTNILGPPPPDGRVTQARF
jgi:hypothetical protein